MKEDNGRTEKKKTIVKRRVLKIGSLEWLMTQTKGFASLRSVKKMRGKGSKAVILNKEL